MDQVVKVKVDFFYIQRCEDLNRSWFILTGSSKYNLLRNMGLLYSDIDTLIKRRLKKLILIQYCIIDGRLI